MGDDTTGRPTAITTIILGFSVLLLLGNSEAAGVSTGLNERAYESFVVNAIASKHNIETFVGGRARQIGRDNVGFPIKDAKCDIPYGGLCLLGRRQ